MTLRAALADLAALKGKRRHMEENLRAASYLLSRPVNVPADGIKPADSIQRFSKEEVVTLTEEIRDVEKPSRISSATSRTSSLASV